MSTLKADTIQNTSGGAVTLTNQHAPKAWVVYVSANLTSNSDLTGVSDSFNMTSVVDNGTGDHTFAVNNDFSNANYALITGRQQSVSGFGGHIDIEHGTSPAAGSVIVQTREHYGVQDNPRGSLAFLGDLA
jgi:hypothetical protein